MKLFNTLTRRFEEFKPIEKNKVRFYHCGPTVYSIQHIGNLRGAVMADFIYRSLTYLGYSVTYVQNYTDVGHLVSDADTGQDKMEKGIKKEGLMPQEIADKYIKIYEKDAKDINIITPSFTPRASEYIDQMIKMIEILLEKGFAYITNLAVVYDTSKFSNYNKLSRQKLEESIKGAGKGQISDPGKKHFADFNLWVFKKGEHKNALQTWPSPWGEGFPGWHIECSVMIKSILGKTIDIHMGGVEHISIHHPNEIAQSEAANGVKFVNYWLHNEHLVADNKKISKSEGVGISLKQVVEKGYDPMALRYLFLNSHYRSRQNFTWQSLKAAQEGYKKLKNYVLVLQKQAKKTKISSKKTAQAGAYQRRFEEAVSNDFQIPKGLALAWEMLKSNILPTEKLYLLFDFDQVFGLRLKIVKAEKIPQEVQNLAKQRWQEKKIGNFKKADHLRQKIASFGFKILDAKKNFTIKRI